MKLRFLLAPIALGFLSCGAMPPPVQAASFDCAKAHKPDEVAVCKHRGLSELDSEMGALWFSYDAFPFLMGMSGRRQDEAHQFLNDRSKCGSNVACLRKLYQERIKALKDGIRWGMKTYASGGDAPSLPAAIETIIAGYAKQCRQLGGTLAQGATRPRIMSADLDGDDKPDYVLNPQNLKCSTAATAFCGNGGCRISIALSGNDYQKPISELGGEPTLSQGSGGTVIEIWVDASRCNARKWERACWLTYSWKSGKIHETYQARPRDH